jgi:hypothetical protein
VLQKYLKFGFQVSIRIILGDVIGLALLVEVRRTDERGLLSVVLIAVEG